MCAEHYLEVKNLKKHFPVKTNFFGQTLSWLKAVDGVDFHLNRGETMGLVGESGCGKSTLGRLIINLLTPTEGGVYFENQNIYDLRGSEQKRLRRKMQIIFQDPYGSLNPRMNIGDIIAEPLYIHGLAQGMGAKKRVRQLLDYVGLSSYHASRYPHEFSGGQRQRVGIARALAVNPELIVCDEPVSALDVSIQSQVLNLLEDLQNELGLTYLFIAHGLNVVKHVSDRVGVMYLGKIMEITDSQELYGNPLHPYTRALLSAIPIPDPGLRRQRIILKGDVMSPIDPPKGCRFCARCPDAFDLCRDREPELVEYSVGHHVACHKVRRDAAG
ncbi:MAG: dipeptide ABC transporter ATP-binding protein [Clostridia bacterium]|nr:dipeptide ABC transporter ATP-binding protein [Clostridia bacterium]